MPPILPAVDKTYPKGLLWLRRDLRVDDNAALWMALRHCREVICAFVFDRAILDDLPRADRRVEFIRESLVELEADLRALGGGLVVRHAVAETEIPALASALGVQCRAGGAASVRRLGALALVTAGALDDLPAALRRAVVV